MVRHMQELALGDPLALACPLGKVGPPALGDPLRKVGPLGKVCPLAPLHALACPLVGLS